MSNSLKGIADMVNVWLLVQIRPENGDNIKPASLLQKVMLPKEV
jgi:hypothetical protein